MDNANTFPCNLFFTTGDSTPTVAGIQPLAFPTTQLSLHPPQFNLKPVPPPGSKSTAAMSASIGGSSTPTGTNPPGAFPSPASSQAQAQAPSAASALTGPSNMVNAQTASASKSSSHPPRGQLHVKLIQARGLNVKSSLSRPYVVVVYEQNEFISREPTHESEKEVKSRPNPLSRQSSSVNVQGTLASKASKGAATAAEIAKEIKEVKESGAMNALKAFDIKPRQLTPKAAGDEERGQSSSRSSSGSSGGSKLAGASTGSAGSSITLNKSSSGHAIHDAMNPVWKHQVSL